jgi:hypothetical protein
VLQYLSSAALFISRAGTVHAVLFARYCSSTVGSLHRAVTMPDDTKAAALRALLETIVKEAEDVEAQDAAARRRV